MFTQQRLGPLSSGHGCATIRSRFVGGLFYYAPLTDLKSDPLVDGVQTTAQVYGQAHESVIGSSLFFSQTTGGTIHGHQYFENCGSAYLADASGDNPHLRLNGNFNLSNLVAPMSASGWARVDELASTGGICGKSQFGVGRNYGLIWDNVGQAYFSFTSGGFFKNATSPVGAVRVGVWNHWVGTYDQVFIRLYRNGELIASTAEVGAVDTLGAVHAIGALEPSGIQTRGCAVRHVATWSGRALSADDVADLYLNGGTLFENSAYGRAIESPETWMPAAAGGAIPPGERKRVLTIGMAPERYAAIGNIDNYPVFGV